MDEARTLATEVETVGGTFDGTTPNDRLYIFTISADVTFPVVESIFNRFIAQHPAAQWYLGNVYAEDGVTPLGWWEDDPGSPHAE